VLTNFHYSIISQIKERKRFNNLMLIASAIGYITDVSHLRSKLITTPSPSPPSQEFFLIITYLLRLYQHLIQVKTLIQKGAEVNVRDKRNLTALHFAAGRGWLDVVQLLWSKAADLDAESSRK
jgi:ankyrin repeat protein